MIELSASDLRAVAEMLETLANIEQSTGVQARGHDRGTLTTPAGDTLYFDRREPDDGDETGTYVLSVES